jgi:hypothetical protein
MKGVNMRTVRVWKKAWNSEEIISEKIEQVQSVAMTEIGALVLYKDGEPYRIYNKDQWFKVESEENRVHSLD